MRQSAAKPLRGKVQRLGESRRHKRAEAPGALRGDDIVSSAWRHAAAARRGKRSELTRRPMIREVIQTLDDANVPQNDRVLIIPPIEKKNLLGLARFTEQAFVGEVGMSNSIRNGMIGNIYGVPVFVSTNCPMIESTDSTPYRVCLLMHKSAMALVMQQAPRVRSESALTYLSTVIVADLMYGVGELRNDGGVAIVVPAT